jgi:antimicrobial peptide system SdpA family protein
MIETQARRGFALGVVLFALIAVVTVVSSLNDAVVAPRWFKSARVTALRVWPQGWSFFTRSPAHLDFGAYRIDAAGRLHDAAIGPYARPGNAFGISRRARAQGPEMAIVTSEVPATAWQPCRGAGYTPQSCGAPAATPAALINNAPLPTLCGPVLLAETQPVPWAWQGLTHHQSRILRTAAVNISCPQQ